MCFSLEASVAGGIVLSTIGVTAIKKVQVPSQYAFASIPLVFGIQQFSEGAVWLSLQNPAFAGLEPYGTNTFLFVARVLWPVLMPLSVLLMENEEKKRKTLRIMLGMGSVVALYYSYCLLFLNVEPNIAGHHIRYISDYPDAIADPIFFLYVMAAIPPLFVSSNTRTRLLGVLFLAAVIVTGVFYVQYLTSVWCFFAAIVSMVILWILKDQDFVVVTNKQEKITIPENAN
jgi:hypothetical protein